MQIDTTETLLHRWSKERSFRTTRAMRLAQTFASARAWEKRSSAFAGAGQFRDADDASTEASALFMLATDLKTEGK